MWWSSCKRRHTSKGSHLLYVYRTLLIDCVTSKLSRKSSDFCRIYHPCPKYLSTEYVLADQTNKIQSIRSKIDRPWRHALLDGNFHWHHVWTTDHATTPHESRHINILEHSSDVRTSRRYPLQTANGCDHTYQTSSHRVHCMTWQWPR